MLKEVLTANLVSSMKARDTQQSTLIRGLLAEIRNAEIAAGLGVVADEAMELTVLTREVNRYKEALDFAKQSGREDRIVKAEDELAVVSAYLPQPLTEDDVIAMIHGVKLVQGVTANLGTIMKALTPQIKGKFDMKRTTELVRELLK